MVVNGFLKLVLNLSGAAIFVIGALHMVLALGADQMLGAVVSEASASDPTLDSQNRFLGVSFTLFGAVFIIAARDLARHAPTLKAALIIFFVGGLARVLSVVLAGWPPAPVIGLIALELILPPLLWTLLNRANAETA